MIGAGRTGRRRAGEGLEAEHPERADDGGYYGNER
jgi:hypothetical protein